MVSCRKKRRDLIYKLISEEYFKVDADVIYECVNNVIDRVYFSDAGLNKLEEVVWFRPSEKRRAQFDEIEDSETKITNQSTSTYIRGLLNEYSRLPQYKRESILFMKELDDFKEASYTGKIFHAIVN